MTTSEDNQPLFASALVRIEKVCCLRARRGLSCEECKTEHQIAIPLSGVNVRHIGGETFTITPSHLTLSNRGESYQVSHPYGSGETQLNIMFHEPLLRELVSGADPAAVDRDRIFELRQKPISLQLRFAIQAFIGALRSRDYSAAEIEETLLNLTQRMLAPATPLRRGRLTPNDRSLALRTDSLLAACYTEPVGLDILAARLNVSVYHLCRVYRRVTGKTLWSEIQQLRTRAALLHLDGGEQDLTALGLSLGFADHSHFTASFRRHLGVTPSTARQLLATGALSQVHQLLSN